MHTSFCNSKRFVSWEEIGSSGLHRLQGVLLLCETNVGTATCDRQAPHFLSSHLTLSCGSSKSQYEVCLLNASTCINDLVNLMMLLPSFAKNSSDFAISCPPGPPCPNLQSQQPCSLVHFRHRHPLPHGHSNSSSRPYSMEA